VGEESGSVTRSGSSFAGPPPRVTPAQKTPPETPQIAGEPLPLSDSSVVAVEFSIATHDFTMNEDDPTHSDSPVLIRAGTCWGW
jgi:hypothetical protein